LKNKIITALILCFINTTITAQFDNNLKCHQIFQKILALDIDSANVLITDAKLKQTDNRYLLLLENTSAFLNLILQQRSSDFEQYSHKWKERIEKIAGSTHNSPYLLNTQAEIYFQTAVVYFIFDKFFESALCLRKSYIFINQNNTLYPNFTPNNKLLGLFNVALSIIPSKYQLFASWLGYVGNRDAGFRMLENYYANSTESCEKNEALIYILLANYVFSDDDAKAQNLFFEMKGNYTDLALVKLVGVVTAMKASNNYLADSLLNTFSKEKYKFAYFDYLKGVVSLRRLNLEAEKYFTVFLENFEGEHFVKSSYHNLLYICYLNGNYKQIPNLKQQLIEKGSEITESDKFAMKMATTEYRVNQALLKSRLLFDGGYYDEALLALNEFHINRYNTSFDTVEFYYRKARILHKLNKTIEALDFYKITIEKARLLNTYFAPYSALQVALIYEQSGSLKLAKTYLLMCLAINNSHYSGSIEHKAKSALKRIDEKAD